MILFVVSTKLRGRVDAYSSTSIKASNVERVHVVDEDRSLNTENEPYNCDIQNTRRSARMKLVLSRTEPRDLDAIVPMLFEAFDDGDLCNVFFGRKSAASYAYTKKLFMTGLQTDPADVFLKIEDLDEEVDVNLLDDKGGVSGTERRKRIVCASNWKIFPTYVTPKEQQEARESQRDGEAEEKQKDKENKAAFSYLETEQERADAAVLMEDFLSRRRRECTEGHVLCFILCTDKEYQRKGCGRMMMQWGNDVADALMLPCWIEASLEGEWLYRKMGYEGRERVRIRTKSFLSEYLHMRRPTTTERVRLENGRMIRERPANRETDEK